MATTGSVSGLDRAWQRENVQLSIKNHGFETWLGPILGCSQSKMDWKYQN